MFLLTAKVTSFGLKLHMLTISDYNYIYILLGNPDVIRFLNYFVICPHFVEYDLNTNY